MKIRSIHNVLIPLHNAIVDIAALGIVHQLFSDIYFKGLIWQNISHRFGCGILEAVLQLPMGD